MEQGVDVSRDELTAVFRTGRTARDLGLAVEDTNDPGGVRVRQHPVADGGVA